MGYRRGLGCWPHRFSANSLKLRGYRFARVRRACARVHGARSCVPGPRRALLPEPLGFGTQHPIRPRRPERAARDELVYEECLVCDLKRAHADKAALQGHGRRRLALAHDVDQAAHLLLHLRDVEVARHHFAQHLHTAHREEPLAHEPVGLVEDAKVDNGLPLDVGDQHVRRHRIDQQGDHRLRRQLRHFVVLMVLGRPWRPWRPWCA
mmetsp:Transcript_95902/g.273439  ORF Transcript_95902/g.273439 Transcript_95902/m.273439 type:complete len:208 (-) Transcript_95902:97-720(-)